MSFTKFKNVVLWVVVLLVALTIVAASLLNNEINQYWGAHTEIVDTQQFMRDQQHIAITNVSVLSVDGEHMLPNQTVIIKDGLITYVGEAPNMPTAITIIDAKGQYLIPGLIDSHVHLWQSPNDLLLYLANGVTHVKELNGSEEHLQWKADISAGRPGPELFIASRRHNSNSLFAGWFHRWTAKMNSVTSVESVEPHTQQLKDAGFDAIKIYSHLSKEHFYAFNQASTQLDMPILGHIPMSLSLPEVWDSQLKELAHVEELVKALDREFGGYDRNSTEAFLQFVQSRSDAIANQLLTNNMALVSTLSIMQSLAPQKRDISHTLQNVELTFVNPGISESTLPSNRVMGWLPEVNIYRLPEHYPADRIAGNQRYWQAYAEANVILLRAMAKKEVKVFAGTDANVPVMVPGFSLHDELTSLSQVGFTSAQTLGSATNKPADWMGLNTGRVQQGYQADLVLLDKNPLDDIRNTQTIDAVISNGRLYDRATLDAMLKAVEKANQQSRSVSIKPFI